MKATSRRAALTALALLAAAFSPARAAETRVFTVQSPIVAVPVLRQDLRPVEVPVLAPLSSLEIGNTLAPAASLVVPGVPAQAQLTVPTGLAEATPGETELSRATQKQLDGLLDRAKKNKQGREEGPQASPESHWAKVFDGSVAKAGAVDASAPALDGKAGYLEETRGLGGAELVTKLHDITGRGAKIKHYDEAKSFMFATADHVTRNGVTGIIDAYSGIFVPGTGPDGGRYAEKGDQNHDGYEDKGGMNVEHTWPQSFFAKAEPMRADLHHLMATFMHPNGERGNLPFGEVKGRPDYHNDAGAKLGGGVFEPPNEAKGRVARSLLYFYTRYYDKRIFLGAFNQGFWDENLPMLLRWNRQFPPTDFEKGRNDAVESLQGNRNPFTDDFTLADRIGEQALRTGNRYGTRRGTANYGGAQTSVAPDLQHVIDGARMRPTPEKLARPLRLIITGPPGSGKGTFSEKLSAQYGVPHISVGDLLRDYAKTHPAIAKTMSQGKLVESSLVLSVVRERLRQPDVRSRGFILDGFPRRPEEAKALSEMLGGAPVDGVISLDVPDEELLKRILARGRADDSEPVFRDRMKIYREQTVPAVEVFTKKAPVLAPALEGSGIEANYAKVKAAVADLVKKLKRR